MKKYIVALAVLLLVLALPLSVFAADVVQPENTALDGAENGGALTDGENGSDAAVEEYADGGWLESAKAWVLENLSGIVLSVFGIYLAIPKVGGIAMVKSLLLTLATLVGAVKKYIDDEKNPNSLVNKLDKLGGLLVEYMNKQEQDGAVSQELMSEVRSALAGVCEKQRSDEQMRSVLLAVEEGLELMATEFSDLISISTTITQKKKAEYESEWMKRISHLRETVKGALEHDEQAEKTIT